MNLKKVRKIFLSLILAMLAPILLNSIFPSLYPLWLVLLFGFGVAALIVEIILWRCPHCGKNLGRGIPKFCPSCGHALEDLL